MVGIALVAILRYGSPTLTIPAFVQSNGKAGPGFCLARNRP